ncbi:hypothetical protein ACFLX3_03795 [Chloroflexota bacterium]
MSIFKAKAKTEKRMVICSAVKSRRIIEFYYHGGDRVAEPFCLGLVMSGDADNESLLCYQVGGYCEYGEPVGWKLYRVSEIEDLKIISEVFCSDRPGYDTDNLEMKTIYCCVSTDRHDEMEPKEAEKPFTPNNALKTEPGTNTDVHADLIKLKDLYTQHNFGAVEPSTNTDSGLKPEKARRLFTRSYIRMIKLSRKLNHNEKISGDIYFHPMERKVIVKTTDLILPNTLCEVNSKSKARLNERNRQYWEKRWVEAYLINQAKNNNWKIKLEKNEYWFLLSQLKFRRDINKEERQGKILDLLLFNDDKQYLVVLELKSQANIPVMNAANIELGDIVTKLKAVVETGEIAEAFGLEEIKGIFAYLMWPKTDIKPDLGKYGLIEFDKIENPWDLYKESGKDLEVRFNNKKGAFNLL